MTAHPTAGNQRPRQQGSERGLYLRTQLRAPFPRPDPRASEGHPELNAVLDLSVVRHAVVGPRYAPQILDLRAVLFVEQIVAEGRHDVLPGLSPRIVGARIHFEACVVFVDRWLRAVFDGRLAL